jgi:LPS export ABC transporter protein LptC
MAKLLGGVGAIALVVLLTVTVVVVRHRAAGEKLAKNVAAVVPGSLLHAHNFHWTQMKGGQSQWVLKATDASYSNDKNDILLVNPELKLTTKEGKSVELHANSAKLKMNGNHITQANMTGGLVMHYGDFTLTTDQCSFYPDDDRVSADGLVTIIGPQMTVTGIGMSGRPNAQTFELLKQVTTQITPKEKSAKAKVS